MPDNHTGSKPNFEYWQCPFILVNKYTHFCGLIIWRLFPCQEKIMKTWSFTTQSAYLQTGKIQVELKSWTNLNIFMIKCVPFNYADSACLRILSPIWSLCYTALGDAKHNYTVYTSDTLSSFAHSGSTRIKNEWYISAEKTFSKLKTWCPLNCTKTCTSWYSGCF